MIISHSNQFIWIKTRKAASSSIEVGLNWICNKKDYINWLKENKKAQEGLKLTKKSELRKYGISPHTDITTLKEKAINQKLITPEEWDSYFKFTIERNPWDKVISYYYYRFANKSFHVTFQKFMNDWNWDICYNWPLYTENDEIKVDYIMKFENIKEEMEFISEKIGKNIELLNENRFRPKEEKDYRQFYNQKNKKKIEKVFKKEIDYFNYKF